MFFAHDVLHSASMLVQMYMFLFKLHGFDACKVYFNEASNHKSIFPEFVRDGDICGEDDERCSVYKMIG